MRKSSSRMSLPTNNSCYENVRVVVRNRPMSQTELEGNNLNIVRVRPARNEVEIFNWKDHTKGNKKFTFDGVFDENTNQEDFYNATVKPLVTSVLEGFNGCIFAYGQTGTGKTYTMEGNINNPEMYGIIPRVFDQIWKHVNETSDTKFLISVAYLEIYMDEVRDLLNNSQIKPLELREIDGVGVYAEHARIINCKNSKTMHKVMQIGNKNRSVGCTNMNEHSSRSHAIFQISIEMCQSSTDVIKAGKLNLIDLAGSERQSKTGSSCERLKEASKINLALSALGNVISALAENASYIPYRSSKLTRLLKNSLGGNSKTIMIANIGPASSNYEETITTLRYANRAKSISNKPTENTNPKDAKLLEYQREIERLKAIITERQLLENNFSACDHESLSSDNSEQQDDEDVTEQNLEILKTLEIEKMKTKELTEQLRNIEKLLIDGGNKKLQNITQHHNTQQSENEEITNESQDEIDKQLKLKDEAILNLRKSYKVLQHQLKSKNTKLTEYQNKCVELKEKCDNKQENHKNDIEELEETQKNFIKYLEHQWEIFQKAISQQTENGKIVQTIKPICPKPKIEYKREIVHPENRRPKCKYALQKAKTTNQTKYRSENVIDLLTDRTPKGTKSYTKSDADPFLSATIKSYFRQEMLNNIVVVNEPPKSFQPRDLDFNALERKFKNAAYKITDFQVGSKFYSDEGKDTKNTEK